MSERPPEAPAPARELTLLSLLELSSDLSDRLDVWEIADAALFNLMGHFTCSRAALWLHPEDAGETVLLRAYGVAPKVARALGPVRIRWLAVRDGGGFDPVLVPELGAAAPDLGLAAANGLELVAPVRVRRRLLGLLALGRRVSGAPFGTRELEMLATSLNFLGVALEHTEAMTRLVENNRQLRAANARLSELDAVKSEFLRNMNHELRTPLTVMALYLESLLASEPEQSPRREQLRVVRTETAKLEGLVVNLLDFGELERDTLGIEKRLADVAAVLRDWCEERRPGISAGLRELRFSTASDVPPALCDPKRVTQIADCLLDNAAKFCPAGTTIHVRVESETEETTTRVRVEVQDDGPGIAPGRLDHIWESFRQGDGSETRRHRGVGVGLALARRLARRMDASLDVETVLGEGSTFILRLPTG